VIKTLQNNLLSTLTSLGVVPGTPVIVAYSGGLDSHVLLHLLASSEYKSQLTAVHINHGLMADAGSWSKHCQQNCLQLDIPITVEKVVINNTNTQGLEAAARDARYAALAKHVRAGCVLLTAHHQDDQAETMLLQLMRGAGVPGLAAMPTITNFADGKLARPLLNISREEIKKYALTNNLQWIEDQSNQDTRFNRNYLRQNVLPVIKKRWPEMSQLLTRSASHQAEASTLLNRLAEQDLSICRLADNQTLDLDKLLLLDTPSLKNVLRYFIHSQNLLLPSERQLAHIIKQLRHRSASGQQQINWSGGVIRVYRRILSVSRCQVAINLSTQLLCDGFWKHTDKKKINDKKSKLRQDNETFILAGSGYSLSARRTIGSGLSIKQLLTGPVTLRFRQGGESCLLAGRGHHHKLKKLFQEAGIPPWERSHLPLIYVGEELAAVADKWVCAPFQAHNDEAGINFRLNPAPE
jgi:tRNA(Ile)-lysidine synthase